MKFTAGRIRNFVLCWLLGGPLAPAQDRTLQPPDQQRVKKIAALLPVAPQGFGPSYQHRSVWDSLHADARYASVLRVADSLLHSPIPPWSDSLYLVYTRNGTRPGGERMMRARTDRLPTLVWAECLQNEGRYVAAIEQLLGELLRQKSWVLPAHDFRNQNFRGRRYTVDLASASFSHDLAQALFLLDDKLSAALRQRIRRELERRTFRPLLKTLRTQNPYHWWLKGTNNWNAVCLAGVTGAALAAIPDRNRRATFVALAERYSKNTLLGFDADGYCPEGLGYYAYGFGHYLLLRENLWQATGGRLDLLADSSIRKIAAYGPNLEIINGVYPNIGDSRIGTQASPEILWYCSRNLGLGLTRYDSLRFGGNTQNLSADLMRVFPNSASARDPAAASALAPGLRSYFPTAGVLIVRPAPGSGFNLGVAVQGGNNYESHNHNDVGSYAIVVGDEMLTGDPGGPFVYNAKTFGPARYESRLLSSYGHPVPLISGRQQRAGAGAKATVLNTQVSTAEDALTMDLSPAYFDTARAQLIRHFVYNRQDSGYFKIEDTVDFTENQTIEEAFITRADWRRVGESTLEFIGKRATLLATIDVPAGNAFSVSSETIDEDGLTPPFTRIAIRLAQPIKSGKVSVTFRVGK